MDFNYQTIMNTSFALEVLIIALLALVCGYVAKFLVEKLDEVTYFSQWKGKHTLEKIIVIAAVLIHVVCTVTLIQKHAFLN